jgi:hypothetical protein
MLLCDKYPLKTTTFDMNVRYRLQSDTFRHKIKMLITTLYSNLLGGLRVCLQDYRDRTI